MASLGSTGDSETALQRVSLPNQHPSQPMEAVWNACLRPFACDPLLPLSAPPRSPKTSEACLTLAPGTILKGQGWSFFLPFPDSQLSGQPHKSSSSL